MSNTPIRKSPNGTFRANSFVKQNPHDDRSIRSVNVVGAKKILSPGRRPMMPKKTFDRKKSKTSLEIQPIESKPGTTENKNINPGRLSLSSANKCNSNTAFILPKKHKLGELPDYLKRRPTCHSIDPILAIKRKSYLASKKKVTEAQTEFLAACQHLEDFQKNRKVEDKEYLNLDRFQLMLIAKDEDGKFLMVKDEDQLKENESSIREPQYNLEQLNAVSVKMTKMIDSGYNLCKEFIDTIKTSKIINDEQIGDGALDKTEILKVLLAMEETIEKELKNKKIDTTELFKTLNVTEFPQPVEKNEFEGGVQELNVKISQLKQNLEDNKFKAQDLEMKVKELEDSNETVRKQLEAELAQKQKEISCKDQDVSKLKKVLKASEEHKICVDKKNDNLMKELIETKSQVSTLQKKVEEMNTQLDNNVAAVNLEELARKEYKNREIELKKKESDLQKLLEEERKRNGLLEKKFRETENEFEKAKREIQTNKKNLDEQYDPKLWAEFQKLKMNYDKIICEKDALKKSLLSSNNEDVSYLKSNLVKANVEIQQYENANKDLLDNIKDLQSEIAKKNKALKEYEESMGAVSNVKDYQNEINNIRESEMERNREMESLQNELCKCRVEIKQQEETIYMHNRLLRIRSELINSLQEKEASTRCCVEDLYGEIANKTSLINQMNHEISAKAEELQNLFSTLGNKEMELSRQETIIKMLEENDSRNQRLRVKQEEKISRLEHENSELKHVISIYQECNPDLDFKEINNNFLEAKSTISTRDFFHEERRGKRQIAIEVKKIEKY